MSRQLLADRVQEQAQVEIKKQQAYFKKDALNCITETNETLKALASGNLKAAKEQVLQAISDAQKVEKDFPDINYVPVNISVSSSDFVSTMQQVDKLLTESRLAMKKGYYQQASELLNQMKSEIDITTVNMLFGSYPEKLEEVEALLDNNKINDAENVLYGLLNSLQIKQTILPIPVLRAEAMIAQSAVSFATNKATSVNLLKNADYQLQLAEAMGYGNFDKEYVLLSKQIRNIVQEIQEGKNTQSEFLALHNNVDQFKSRLFYVSKDIR
ncbi:MAG: YfdX family protein [Bacteroidales bacterium]|nr:YfdX family protein [Bacteroidales bacterium]